MKIPPAYSVTSEMLAVIAAIEAQRIYFTSLNLAIPIKEKIQRVSLLKSSLFSARIEGNTLRLTDLDDARGQVEKKREVFNIVEAVSFIDSNVRKGDLPIDILQKLHTLTMDNIASDAGRFRTEVSAIFNQAGVAIYMPPAPSNISSLLHALFEYINSENEKLPLVTAFIAHLVFEKIHPFLDGNGRVGRLLIAAILKAKGWDFTLTVPFEEYLDEYKDRYYYHLDNGMSQTNDYLLFMLEAFLSQIEGIKAHVEEELAKKEAPFLPPRQEEIYNIIKDHVVVSFDMIRRRFLSVPPRTLRYDLKKLVDKDLIEKSGETKGSYYRVKKIKHLVLLSPKSSR